MPPYRTVSIMLHVVFGLVAAFVAVLSLPLLAVEFMGPGTAGRPITRIFVLSPLVYLATYAASLACAFIGQYDDPSGRRALLCSLVPLVGLAWGVIALGLFAVLCDASFACRR
jgi:hypothetical protein